MTEIRACVPVAAVAIFLSGYLAGGVAVAEDPIPPAVADLSPAVRLVVHGGYWSEGNREGSLRAIVVQGGVEHVSHELFLQWLEFDADTGDESIAHSVRIEGVAGDSAEGHLISIARDDGADFGVFRALVSVSATRSGSEQQYLLNAGTPLGKYSLRPAD